MAKLIKKFKETIHDVQFGNYIQEWELLFDYSDEEVDNIKVTAHNYNNGKFSHSTDITEHLPADFITAMVASVNTDTNDSEHDDECEHESDHADIHPTMQAALSPFFKS